MRTIGCRLALAVAALAGPVAAEPAAPQSVAAPAVPAAYVVPSTPWGDPDLQGTWPGTGFANVPLERAPELGARNLLTDDELAARALRERLRKEAIERDGAGGLTGSPGHWTEWGQTQRQASLIVDPPDGRLPSLTREAAARASRQPLGTSGNGPLDGPADFTTWERCISRGVLGSTLPTLYNSGIDITQGPGFVAMRYEMVHDHRVIPLDSRPPLSPAIQQYMGDARGRWDGDTLVVVTSRFNGRTGPGPNGGAAPNTPEMVLTERFTRVSHDTIQYQATVDDPATWTAPWTVAFDLRLEPGYVLHEYACHEGNYAIRHALEAARNGD